MIDVLHSRNSFHVQRKEQGTILMSSSTSGPRPRHGKSAVLCSPVVHQLSILDTYDKKRGSSSSLPTSPRTHGSLLQCLSDLLQLRRSTDIQLSLMQEAYIKLEKIKYINSANVA
jgi:hypothetical protein